MYSLVYTKQYERSIKKLKHSGKFNESELESVIDSLAEGKRLNVVYRDHALRGEYEGYRECHIRGDLLLIYKIEHSKLVLLLVDIGSHSYLFG